MAQVFYKCKKCGKMVAVVTNSSCPTMCCGEEMVEVKPNTTDAAVEKHVPVVKVEGNKVVVEVGSVTHPMTPEHSIEWISLQTNAGNQRKVLTPNDAPQAVFYIGEDETVEAAYAYCNLHGLWSGK